LIKSHAPRYQVSRHTSVVSLTALHTSRLYPWGNIPGTRSCYRLSRSQVHTATGRIILVKNSNDTVFNRTRVLRYSLTCYVTCCISQYSVSCSNFKKTRYMCVCVCVCLPTIAVTYCLCTAHICDIHSLYRSKLSHTVSVPLTAVSVPLTPACVPLTAVTFCLCTAHSCHILSVYRSKLSHTVSVPLTAASVPLTAVCVPLTAVTFYRFYICRFMSRFTGLSEMFQSQIFYTDQT
jgi:hypothetical protein